MDAKNHQAKERELRDLKTRVAQLEQELARPAGAWQASEYYTAYYATTGIMLGIFGAAASLLFNVVGSLIFEKHPLQIIRVYLTFPLKERALDMDSGIALAVGCCLYLGTGMLLGMLFHLVLTRYTAGASFGRRLVVASILGIAVWLFNFYGILSWLQPLLLGGNWIVREIPWLVAASTHLIFAWTMALVYPLGLYIPYTPPTEQS